MIEKKEDIREGSGLSTLQGSNPHMFSHLQFRIELYCKLLGYSEQAKLQHLRVGLGGKRVFASDLQHTHYWEKRDKQGTCKWCLYELMCQKVLGKGI
jgi:hypothetical protein